jgi:hypothetical protein
LITKRAEPAVPPRRRNRRPKRLRAAWPPQLTIEQVLGWADDHHARTGSWPKKTSGPVSSTGRETWCGIDIALKRGGRGLPGGFSLACLLLESRGVRHRLLAPKLSYRQILRWADAHHDRTGDWPRAGSGAVHEAGGEDWRNLDAALYLGARGLPSGDSLARLLQRARRVRNRKSLPPLRVKQILMWADQFFVANGRWPNASDGHVAGAKGETWPAINAALHCGSRGLPGGMSLPRILAQHRDVRNRKDLPRLTERHILSWARALHAATSTWPNENSGPVSGANGEVWANINQALRQGLRGLPGGDTLARLLARRLGVRNNTSVPPLTLEQVLLWADAHFRRCGRWPKASSGPVRGATNETWQAIDDALRMGLRRLPAGASLARLLAANRSVRNIRNLPPLRLGQIRSWAREHRQQHGRWPDQRSGPIPGSDGETWCAVEQALRKGLRGLPGSNSLSKLIRPT